MTARMLAVAMVRIRLMRGDVNGEVGRIYGNTRQKSSEVPEISISSNSSALFYSQIHPDSSNPGAWHIACDSTDDLVLPSWHRDCFSRMKITPRDLGHFISGHPEEFRQAGHLHPATLMELSASEARTERHHFDLRSREFGMK